MIQTKSGGHVIDTLNLGSFQVEGVSPFTHLGRHLTSNNDWTEKVQCRISAVKTVDFPWCICLKQKRPSDQSFCMPAICGRFLRVLQK